MLSFNVIIFCYHFPPFFLFPENVTHSQNIYMSYNIIQYTTIVPGEGLPVD
jgi:hypothetical protein